MSKRKPCVSFLSFLVLALLLSGCGQQKAAMTKTIRAQPMPFTVVSTKDTMTDVSSAATFTWARGMREIHSDPHQHKAPDKDAGECHHQFVAQEGLRIYLEGESG
jgi:PBP1b-binding outer membrane lipoprotein LpoB